MVRKQLEVVEKITFSDLSWDLKALAILGWIFVGLLILAFIVGFIEGVMSPQLY